MVPATGWLSTSARMFKNNAPDDKGGRVSGWRYRLSPQTSSDAASA